MPSSPNVMRFESTSWESAGLRETGVHAAKKEEAYAPTVYVKDTSTRKILETGGSINSLVADKQGPRSRTMNQLSTTLARQALLVAKTQWPTFCLGLRPPTYGPITVFRRFPCATTSNWVTGIAQDWTNRTPSIAWTWRESVIHGAFGCTLTQASMYFLTSGCHATREILICCRGLSFARVRYK